MKTFKQFQEGLSLSQAFDRAGYKPGIPSERPTRTTTLPGLVQRQRERATAVQQAVQLPYSTYSGRVEAGRRPPGKNYRDNPNSHGGRMPGTTPESNPQLPPRGKNFSVRPPGTNFAKPTTGKTSGPKKPKPQGMGGWV